MENLFKENQIVFINFNESEPQVFDLSICDKNEIIEQINELYDENSPINIFGNIDGVDFFRTNDNSYDLETLIDSDEYTEYHNWEELLDNFNESFEGEIYDFQFDEIDLVELTYYFSPTNIYGDDDELTEEGWNNISENFMEKLDEVISDYPIAIISKDIQDYDEYEYNDHMRIRFEIRPFVKNSKLL